MPANCTSRPLYGGVFHVTHTHVTPQSDTLAILSCITHPSATTILARAAACHCTTVTTRRLLPVTSTSISLSLWYHPHFLPAFRPPTPSTPVHPRHPALDTPPHALSLPLVCHVVDTVARARGGVVHTRGITSHSPGGASCAPVMPQVGPTWGLPQACDAPGGGGVGGV